MKNIILHIGRHKSGTSSLQKYFVDNESYLGSVGWHYPRALRTPIAHHSVARFYNENQMRRLSVKEKDILSRDIDSFWKECEFHDQLVISSENFQNINPKNLVECFKYCNLQIVVYLREISSYLLSAYAQAIKAQSLSISLEEYEKRIFSGNYYSFLNAWRMAFPDADILVRCFDRSEMCQGDIRSDFVNASWLKDSVDPVRTVFSNEDRNPSIGGSLLEFKKYINSLNYQESINAGAVYPILQRLAIDYSEYSSDKYISPEIMSLLRDKYTDEIEQVYSVYGISKGTLFDDSRVSSSVYYDMSKEVPDIVERVIKIDPVIGYELKMFLNKKNFSRTALFGVLKKFLTKGR